MNILVPCSSPNFDEATLVSVNDAKTYGVIVLSEHGILERTYGVATVDAALKESLDYAVVSSAQEDIEIFIEHNIDVLCGIKGQSIDDIVEGFLFKTLLEL